jgi:hypothetical protein
VIICCLTCGSELAVDGPGFWLEHNADDSHTVNTPARS